MTQWQKMTDEQKKAHMEKQKYYRHRKKARELGISLEEYRSRLIRGTARRGSINQGNTRVAETNENFGWTQYGNPETLSDYRHIRSDKRPWLTFVLEKHTFTSDQGSFVGYKTIDILTDTKVKEEYDRMMEEQG